MFDLFAFIMSNERSLSFEIVRVNYFVDSVWDECGRCPMDSTKRSRASRRFQERDVAMLCHVTFCALMLPLPVPP